MMSKLVTFILTNAAVIAILTSAGIGIAFLIISSSKISLYTNIAIIQFKITANDKREVATKQKTKNKKQKQNFVYVNV